MTKLLGAILIVGFCANAFAGKSKAVLNCSNGEEVSLELREVAIGLFKADVTVQSVGDSYPTFHFSNIAAQNGFEDPAKGSPAYYVGEGFKLTVRTTSPGVPATLDVPSLGIENLNLNCQ